MQGASDYASVVPVLPRKIIFDCSDGAIRTGLGSSQWPSQRAELDRWVLFCRLRPVAHGPLGPRGIRGLQWCADTLLTQSDSKSPGAERLRSPKLRMPTIRLLLLITGNLRTCSCSMCRTALPR